MVMDDKHDKPCKMAHLRQQPAFQRLGGKDLLCLRKKNTTLPVRGEKDFAPDNSPWQQYRLQEVYTSQKELLLEERGARLGSVAQATWHPDRGQAEITVERGKFWLTMGHHRNGKKWLYPEEALFLIDMGALELYYSSVALSVQEAYSMVIPKDIPLDYYQVYSHLLRLGYIVKRHQGSQFTKHERAIRIERYHPKRRYSPYFNLSSQPESSESYEPGSTSSDYEGRHFRNHTDLSMSTGSSEDSPKSTPGGSESDNEDLALSSASSSYFSDGPFIPILPPEPEVKAFSVDLLAFKRKIERKQSGEKSDQKSRKRLKLLSDKSRSNVKGDHTKDIGVPSKDKDIEKEKPKVRKRSKSWEQTGSKRDPDSSDSSDNDKSVLSNTKVPEIHANESSSVDINDVFDVFRDLVNAQTLCKPQLAINNEQHSSSAMKYSKWNYSQMMLPNLAENLPMNELPTIKQGVLPSSIEMATREKLEMDTSNVLKLQQLMRMSNEVMKSSETMVRMSQNVCDSMKAMGSMDHMESDNRAAKRQGVSTPQPRNWSEYKKLQKECKELRTSARPARTFYGDKIQPLVHPRDAHSTAQPIPAKYMAALVILTMLAQTIPAKYMAALVTLTMLAQTIPAKYMAALVTLMMLAQTIPAKYMAALVTLMMLAQTIPAKYMAALVALTMLAQTIPAKYMAALVTLMMLAQTIPAKYMAALVALTMLAQPIPAKYMAALVTLMMLAQTIPAKHMAVLRLAPLITNNFQGAVLEKLNIIQNVNLCANRRSKCDKSLPIHIAFDVYLPDYGYKKTAPGKPNLSVCVMNYKDQPPALHIVAALTSQSQGVPLLWAILDNADITFFVFHDVNLPNDITLG
ncbi:uncharacterized protein LOC144435534 [Glandiceps talaboti]